jgi:uncharacterized protein YkwD
MTHLRPQIVAAASIPARPKTAVGPARTRDIRLRIGRLLALAAFITGLSGVGSSAAATADQPASALRPLEEGVRTKLNALRRQRGLRPLRLSFDLTRAARRHSTEMASRGYFDHTSVSGRSFERCIARFYPAGRGRYWSVGENLLWSSPELNATAVLKLWLNSPQHRKIMLMTRLREIGVGAIHVGSAPGVYGGREVTIVTADFGVRR